MIIEMIMDDSIKPSDKLLYVLFEVGFATKPQLAHILGWDVYKVTNTIHYIRTHHEAKGVKWLDMENCNVEKGGRPHSAYSLTKYAISQIKEVRGVDSNLKTPKPIQLNHYLGITNILARLMKVLGKKNWDKVEWWSEHESRTYVINQYFQKIKSFAPNTKVTPSMLMKLLAPDAYLRILRQPFWIEFDNNTENGKKLQERYMRYVKAYYPRKNGFSMVVKSIEYPVIWVTKTETRKRFMERKWDEVRERSQRDIKNARTKFPMMFFMVEGNETQFLIEYAQNATKIQKQQGPIQPTPQSNQTGRRQMKKFEGEEYM